MRLLNITTHSLIYARNQTVNLLSVLYQNMLFLMFSNFNIKEMCSSLHSNNTAQRGLVPKAQWQPFVLIRGKSLFHVVICSFRVSSCDKKNLEWIFIPYDVSPEARGYKTHNSFHNTSYGMKIHLRSYISDNDHNQWRTSLKVDSNMMRGAISMI